MNRSKTILDFVAMHREQTAILQTQQHSMSDHLVATSKEITARNNITYRLRESAEFDAWWGFKTPECLDFGDELC